MRGAGGTEGGIGHFFIGLIMMCIGFYMLLNAITVTSNCALGTRLYGLSVFGGSYGVTGGMIMVPFMFGVAMLFYNAKNIIAWLLSIGSVAALIVGVISSVRFTMKSMTAFELIVILVLALGGLGLFLRSLKALSGRYS